MLYSLLVRRTCRSSTETPRVSRLTTSLPVLIRPRRSALATEALLCGDQRAASVDGKSGSSDTISFLSLGLLAKTARVASRRRHRRNPKSTCYHKIKCAPRLGRPRLTYLRSRQRSNC